MRHARHKPSSYPEWSEALRAYLRPRFLMLSGKVFRISGMDHARRIRKRFLSCVPETVDENTDNHVHFWYFDGSTYDGVRRNMIMADTVRLAWQEVLDRMFPATEFRLFVSNEYSVGAFSRAEPFEASESIETVLRLWTVAPEAEEFDSSYRVESAVSGDVLWTDYLDKERLPLTRMFEKLSLGVADDELRTAAKRSEAQYGDLTRRCSGPADAGR